MQPRRKGARKEERKTQFSQVFFMSVVQSPCALGVNVNCIGKSHDINIYRKLDALCQCLVNVFLRLVCQMSTVITLSHESTKNVKPERKQNLTVSFTHSVCPTRGL